MRLTLRTLLAYMDDILEDEDKAILKAKIDESSFATSLIAKIRTAVDHRQIAALSPDAIGPLENANVISEYLDSTLSAEQISEIERHCLESEVSLAEAAACHQILTMALGQPARVVDALKQKLYDLPQSPALAMMENQNAPAADASRKSASAREPIDSSFSALNIPDDANDAGLATGVPVASAAPDPKAATFIRPVGPDDSGVSDAPARLRNAGRTDEGLSEAEIVAGATRAALERGDAYGGSIRPSRITPWLVTLALAGIVLYALGQIFSPLTQSRVADIGAVGIQDELNPRDENFEVVNLPEESIAESTQDTGSSNVDGSDETDVSPGANADEDATDNETMASQEPEPIANENAGESTVAVASDAKEASIPEPMDSREGTSPVEADVQPTEPEVDSAMAVKPPVASIAAIEKKPEPATSTPVVAVDELAVVAKLLKTDSLVLVSQGESWARLMPTTDDGKADDVIRKDADAIRSGQSIVAPALYRPLLAGDGPIEWTLAGPTRMQIYADGGGVVTELSDGKVILAATEPDVTTKVRLGERELQVSMVKDQTVLAIEMRHLRPVGMNPLVEANRKPFFRIMCVQGEVKVQPTAADVRVASGDASSDDVASLTSQVQWLGRGTEPAEVGKVNELPAWIDPPAKRDALVLSAREGLLDFIEEDKPLETSLREATGFRRVEVAALAAETLLLLGRADVYFGADGILSKVQQRLYWSEHFEMLRQHIASDAKSAEAVRDAVARAELADSAALFELLTGYSQAELEKGADNKLVEYLDSPSMPVRVLAIENLKDIMGDTLGYQASNENANSRRSDIKKWEARLRRGDIRYN